MPRCTVGTAGPPEEPPLCAEEAMCGAGRAASGAAGRAGGVRMGVGAGERLPRRGAGRQATGYRQRTGWKRQAHTKAAAGLRAKEETRSPPPPHVLLAAQACQSATALRPISVQNPPDLKPIGTLFVKPRPLVPKRVGSSRKR